MSSNEQDGSRKGDGIYFWGCGGIVFLLFSYLLFGAFWTIVDNWNNHTPLTFGHLARLGFCILVMCFGLLIFIVLPNFRKNPGLSFWHLALLLLSWVATAFLMLYLSKGVSFTDFFSIVRYAPRL
jgi:hypothetical protein